MTLDEAQNQMLIVAQILSERHAQHEKWGEQNHPDLSPNLSPPPIDTPSSRRWWRINAARYYGIPLAEKAKEYTDTEHKAGAGSWFTIHVEELAEALEAAALGDTDALRTELVQLAATVTAHIEAIDRRPE